MSLMVQKKLQFTLSKQQYGDSDQRVTSSVVEKRGATVSSKFQPVEKVFIQLCKILNVTFKVPRFYENLGAKYLNFEQMTVGDLFICLSCQKSQLLALPTTFLPRTSKRSNDACRLQTRTSRRDTVVALVQRSEATRRRRILRPPCCQNDASSCRCPCSREKLTYNTCRNVLKM